MSRAALLFLVPIVAVCGAACGDDDDGGSGDEPAWTTVLGRADLDRVLLSVWVAGSDEIYAVGGDPGAAPGTANSALIVRYDGEIWREIPAADPANLWWVWGADNREQVFAVGEAGRIYRIADGQAEAMDSPTELTLFGVWGAAPDDVWAVGGDPLASEPTAVILHFDGTAWVDVTPDLDVGGALFKVWGSSSSDVVVVGQAGTIARYDGTGWTLDDSGVTATLFTVSGTAADEVWAVGGPPATILRHDGSAWTAVDTGIPADVLNGVAAAPGGDVVAVGVGGVKLRLRAGQWRDESFDGPMDDLHAVWLAPDGSGYAVGGNYNAPGGSERVGVIGYYGSDPPSATLAAP